MRRELRILHRELHEPYDRGDKLKRVLERFGDRVELVWRADGDWGWGFKFNIYGSQWLVDFYRAYSDEFWLGNTCLKCCERSSWQGQTALDSMVVESQRHLGMNGLNAGHSMHTTLIA